MSGKDDVTLGKLRELVIFVDSTKGIDFSSCKYDTVEKRAILKELRAAIFRKQPVAMYDYRKDENDKPMTMPDFKIYIRNNVDFKPDITNMICYPYRSNGIETDYWLSITGIRTYGIRDSFLCLSCNIKNENDSRLINKMPLRNEQIDIL